jgi:two-component system cell cycle response regulator DivK
MATVVIVEDNPDNMKLFRAVLQRAGHQLIEFTSGVGLADGLAGVLPDVVLLDIQLPDRDGLAVLGDLRARYGRGLVVVALTAHVLPVDQLDIQAAGFDGFIAKPIQVSEFAHQVSEAIAAGRRRDDGIIL